MTARLSRDVGQKRKAPQMNDRFVAVNVGTGDAFFLRRSNSRVLVDGCQARGFLRRLRRATSADTVNVLVCTHNDSDHASGVIEFLEEGGSADECWLPATWMEAVSRVCTATRDEIESLVFSEDEELPEIVPREGEEVSASQLSDQLEAIIEGRESSPLAWLGSPGWLCIPPGIVVPRQLVLSRRVVHPLLEDAVRIVAIALAAHRLQIPIRWFDPETMPTASTSTFLNVLNAREVTSMRRSTLPLRGVVNLTTVNRLSLVLYSPPSDKAPGVLFCSDSGLRNVPSPPSDRGMIVTAPHHGSADPENVAVYNLLDTAGSEAVPGSWLWVRSDRDCSARPCPEYLKRDIRYCTRCRGRSRAQASQDVVLDATGGAWASTSRRCNCTP